MIRSHKVLYNSATAGTGAWFRLDSRFEVDADRALQVILTSGDTIKIQGTTMDLRGMTSADVVASITADDISDLKSYTTSQADNLAGPWTYIRVVKTGTAGAAKVQGFI